MKWGNNPRRRTTTDYWKKPLTWNAHALDFQRVHGRRQRVFCASLADVFDNQADPQWRTDLFALIRECDQLDWQLLTKRPQNICKMLPSDWGRGYANVWLGTTTEDARAYRQRAAHLLRLPAKVHFISYEPALGPIGALKIGGSAPDWVIIGGESGVHVDRTRHTNPKWARDAIAECRQVGAAPFLKQWGTYANNPLVAEKGLLAEEAKRLDPPENGKGGGMLDGRLWREFPLGASVVSATGRRAIDAVEGRTVSAW